MLTVSELVVGYGGGEVLHGVSLFAPPGTITGVIGPNGAGKSTLLKAIFGYLRPAAGRVEFEGRPVAGLRPDQVVRRGLAFVAQTPAIFPRLTVYENLLLGAYTLDRPACRLALEQVFSEYPVLAGRRGQVAGTLPGGHQRLLELVRATMLQPRMIMLDEPSAAMAPRFIDQMYDAIVALQRQGIALLIVEQNVELLLDVAHHVYALNLGRNAYSGLPDEFRHSGRLGRLFLGKGEEEVVGWRP